MPLSLAAEPLFGLPLGRAKAWRSVGYPWTSVGGNGTTNLSAWPIASGPRPNGARSMEALYIFTYLGSPGSNGFLSSLTGMNCKWQLGAQASTTSGGNGTWSGLHYAFAPRLNFSGSGVASLSYTWGSTRDEWITFAAFRTSRRLRLLSTASATHAGSGSLTVGPTNGVIGGCLAVAQAYSRSGSLAIPAGWTQLSWNAATSDGPASLIYKMVAPNEDPTITWTGPAGNSVGCILLFG